MFLNTNSATIMPTRSLEQMLSGSNLNFNELNPKEIETVINNLDKIPIDQLKQLKLTNLQNENLTRMAEKQSEQRAIWEGRVTRVVVKGSIFFGSCGLGLLCATGMSLLSFGSVVVVAGYSLAFGIINVQLSNSQFQEERIKQLNDFVVTKKDAQLKINHRLIELLNEDTKLEDGEFNKEYLKDKDYKSLMQNLCSEEDQCYAQELERNTLKSKIEGMQELVRLMQQDVENERKDLSRCISEDDSVMKGYISNINRFIKVLNSKCEHLQKENDHAESQIEIYDKNKVRLENKLEELNKCNQGLLEKIAELEKEKEDHELDCEDYLNKLHEYNDKYKKSEKEIENHKKTIDECKKNEEYIEELLIKIKKLQDKVRSLKMDCEHLSESLSESLSEGDSDTAPVASSDNEEFIAYGTGPDIVSDKNVTVQSVTAQKPLADPKQNALQPSKINEEFPERGVLPATNEQLHKNGIDPNIVSDENDKYVWDTGKKGSGNMTVWESETWTEDNNKVWELEMWTEDNETVWELGHPISGNS